MPRLLSTLGGAAAIYTGIEAGREQAYRRDRARTLDTRSDEEYERFKRPAMERAESRGRAEHADFEDERGARAAAAEAANAPGATPPPGGASPAAPPAAQPAAAAPAGGMQTDTGPAPASTPSAPAGGAAGGFQPLTGAPAALNLPVADPAAAQAQKPTWLRTAEAMRDYWTRKGRPERASKAMTDAINNSIAEREAYYKYNIAPRMEKIRDAGLTAQELQNDKTFRGLREEAVQHELSTAGLMWGHVLTGNVKAAVDRFNASGVVQPGVKVASIGQTPDGKGIAMLDAEGRVVKDKEGRDLVYSRQALDQLWNQSQTTTTTLKKGDTLVQTRRGPDGTTSVTPVFTAPDPEADRKAGNDRKRNDNADRTLLERRVTQARDAVKNQLFAGQTMMDKVDPGKQKLHGIASPKAEEYVRGGMDPGAAAQKAIKDAEDQLKRDAAGAGPAAAPGTPRPPSGQPGAAAPTWQDVLQ